MHRAAMPPQRRPDGADAGAASSLLLPELFAGTGNLPAGFGGVRTGTLPGAVMLHRFPKQVFVHRAENLVGEIERSNLRAAQIMYLYRCHNLLLSPRAYLFCLSLCPPPTLPRFPPQPQHPRPHGPAPP